MMSSFRCLQVSKTEAGISRRIATAKVDELPVGDVLVRVAYSSLNYKDALSATGHPGVTRKFPHVPGIDAVGVVESSSDTRFAVGQSVLVNGFDLGQNTWGGWGELVRVPAEWATPLPGALSQRDAAIHGVAGFTAALSMAQLLAAGLRPDQGPVLVTGATGGVGSVAVALLARTGFQVVAATGKADAEPYLRALGAQEILPREALLDGSKKPLLPARWAGVVDTVGGLVLANAIRSCLRGACVAASGLVGGVDLPLSIYPFILRGVQLAGIDSAEYPATGRPAIWEHLAGDWRPANLELLVADTVGLEGLEPHIVAILAGQMRGRVVIEHA